MFTAGAIPNARGKSMDVLGSCVLCAVIYCGDINTLSVLQICIIFGIKLICYFRPCERFDWNKRLEHDLLSDKTTRASL